MKVMYQVKRNLLIFCLRVRAGLWYLPAKEACGNAPVVRIHPQTLKDAAASFGKKLIEVKENRHFLHLTSPCGVTANTSACQADDTGSIPAMDFSAVEFHTMEFHIMNFNTMDSLLL